MQCCIIYFTGVWWEKYELSTDTSSSISMDESKVIVSYLMLDPLGKAEKIQWNIQFISAEIWYLFSKYKVTWMEMYKILESQSLYTVAIIYIKYIASIYKLYNIYYGIMLYITLYRVSQKWNDTPSFQFNYPNSVE